MPVSHLQPNKSRSMKHKDGDDNDVDRGAKVFIGGLDEKTRKKDILVWFFFTKILKILVLRFKIHRICFTMLVQ